MDAEAKKQSARFLVREGSVAIVYEEAETHRPIPDFVKVGTATPEDLERLPDFEQYLKALTA